MIHIWVNDTKRTMNGENNSSASFVNGFDLHPLSRDDVFPKAN